MKIWELIQIAKVTFFPLSFKQLKVFAPHDCSPTL